MHRTFTPNGAMFKLQHRVKRRELEHTVHCISSDEKASRLLSPQTVVEGLHSVFGDAVRAAERADPPEHAGHVHDPAFGLLDEREDAQCHIYHSQQIDRQHGFKIGYGEPVGGAGGHRHASVVHDSPQACSESKKKCWKHLSMVRETNQNGATHPSLRPKS